MLDDEEKKIFRRGRNTNPATVPKNADMIDYRHATAFETVLGYLYLMGEYERLNKLMNIAAEIIEQEGAGNSEK
jgi:ribonuclease-3 family protein